jgi:CheY-like chemotaxis protein
MISNVKKPNVLAVDHYPANLTALEAVLADDYNVILATSGAEAVSVLLTRTDISIILMDIQMPEMDGFETAAHIKQIKGADEIPIIFITAVYNEDPFVKKGYAVGGVDYFSKPFDPEILKLKMAVYSTYRQRGEVLKAREMQIKETEELLRAGRKLSAVLEGLPVGVLISDVDGRICQINAHVSEICRGTDVQDPNSYAEMLGWWDRTGKLIKEKGTPLQKAIHDGLTSRSEAITLSCRDGSPKKVLCSASPLFGLDRRIVGAVVVLQDLTESKEIEKNLEDRITRLVSIGVELEEGLQLNTSGV